MFNLPLHCRRQSTLKNMINSWDSSLLDCMFDKISDLEKLHEKQLALLEEIRLDQTDSTKIKTYKANYTQQREYLCGILGSEPASALLPPLRNYTAPTEREKALARERSRRFKVRQAAAKLAMEEESISGENLNGQVVNSTKRKNADPKDFAMGMSVAVGALSDTKDVPLCMGLTIEEIHLRIQEKQKRNEDVTIAIFANELETTALTLRRHLAYVKKASGQLQYEDFILQAPDVLLNLIGEKAYKDVIPDNMDAEIPPMQTLEYIYNNFKKFKAVTTAGAALGLNYMILKEYLGSFTDPKTQMPLTWDVFRHYSVDQLTDYYPSRINECVSALNPRKQPKLTLEKEPSFSTPEGKQNPFQLHKFFTPETSTSSKDQGRVTSPTLPLSGASKKSPPHSLYMWSSAKVSSQETLSQEPPKIGT